MWILVIIGALAAMRVAVSRWQKEAVNRSVELVLDWDEVRSLSDETGTPIAEVLRQFYDAGARGVAIGEESIGEMQGLRRLDLVPPAPAPTTAATPAQGTALPLPVEMTTRLRVPDPVLRKRIMNTLGAKWRIKATESGDTLTIPAAWSELYGLSIGFPQDVVAYVREAHLEPVLRVMNFLGADPESVDWASDQLKASGGRLIVFGGDQVLGFPGSVKDTADAFEARGLIFGQVEFGKQKGEDQLAQEMKGGIVRVHSISPAEMSRMAPADAVDRFLRAAQERNIRAMYVRMLPGAPSPAVQSNVQYVKDIARALRNSRVRDLDIGFAGPFPPYESNRLERCVMGLGVAAATLLIVLYLWPAQGLTLALVLLLCLIDIIAPAAGIGRKLVALQGALLLPVLAFLVLRAILEGEHAIPDARLGLDVDIVPRAGRLFPATIRAIGLFLLTSLISLLGALFVVGLLSSRLGSMKIVEFSGIKAQQAGAILIVAAIFYLDISARGGLVAARMRVQKRIVALWEQPLMLGGLVLFFAAIVVLGLLLARSGNEPGVGVSAVELKFRVILDRLLGVRPRTKEFLIGHPALLIGIALLTLRRLRWGLPVLIIGAIGQVSIVNTFCHLHTPLAISLVHVLNGLWTGILVALVAALVIDALAPKKHVALPDQVRGG